MLCNMAKHEWTCNRIFQCYPMFDSYESCVSYSWHFSLIIGDYVITNETWMASLNVPLSLNVPSITCYTCYGCNHLWLSPTHLGKHIKLH